MENSRAKTEQHARKQIKRGAVISYAALLVNIAFTLFYYPWMVQKIGQANYGLYNLAISLISLFMFDFGLSTAVSRFVAKYAAENRQEYADEFVGAVYKVYFAIDFLIAVILIVLYFFLDKIYVRLTPEELKVFRNLYIIVAGFILISYPMTPLNGIISAYERFAPLKSCELINRFLSGILVIVALLMNAGVEVLVFAYAFTGVAVIAIKLWIVFRQTPLKVRFRTEHKDTYRNILTFSLWTLIVNLANRLATSSVPSILAMTSGSAAVALYSPAAAIEGYYYGIANAINGLFLPMISRIISDKREEALLPLMTKVGRYQAAILGLLFAGLFCIGDDFMINWMGGDFRLSYYCIILLCIPSFFHYSQQIGNTTIIAKGLMKEWAAVAVGSTVIGVVACYLMSSAWGAVGGCAAVCISGMLKNFGLNWIHSRKIGIDIKKFYKDCYIRMSIPILVTCAAGRVLSSVIGDRGIMWLIIKIAVITVLYAVILWLFALNAEEKKTLAQLIGRYLPGRRKSTGES